MLPRPVRAAGPVAQDERRRKDLAGQFPYPAIFHAADIASRSAQRLFLRLSACRLWALVAVAAIAALAGFIDRWSAYIALAPISIAIFAEIILWTQRPERRWYQARAIAESAKTLAWRYQVGGRPLGRRITDEEADAELIARLRDLLKEFRDLAFPATKQDQVTTAMRKLRSMPLHQRMVAYRKGRIEDQRTWYANRAERNRKCADQYQAGLVFIELAAFSTALLTALLGLSVNVYSLLAALAVAGVGWLQIKQYRSTADSYALASHELAAINSTFDTVDGEDAWEEFVDRAEEAISREHTLWVASNSRRSLHA